MVVNEVLVTDSSINNIDNDEWRRRHDTFTLLRHSISSYDLSRKYTPTAIRNKTSITKQIYDLNIRSSRASVTILVRQRGHSRDEVMTRSEHPRHKARCLAVRSCQWQAGMAKDAHVPAVHNRNISLLILTYDA